MRDESPERAKTRSFRGEHIHLVLPYTIVNCNVWITICTIPQALLREYDFECQ